MFRIVGESFPYARYMSYQTYDIPGFMSQVPPITDTHAE